jgi:hypothetical protein
MSFESVQRPMTADERVSLQDRLRSAPRPWKQAAENFGVLWACSMLLLTLGWGLIGWLAGRVSDANIGWKSPFALWIVPLSVGCTLCYALYSTLRWIQPVSARRQLLHADLATGIVQEEQLTFVEAMCFQEPEHDGLIYFLRTADDRVFATFDYESQDLGAGGEDAFSSSFRPKSQLRLVRLPSAREPLRVTFYGEILPTDRVLKLSAPAKQWPKDDEFIDVPWAELERQFSTPS